MSVVMNGIGSSTRRAALMLTCALVALCLWADTALASGNLSINNLHSGGPITSTNQPLVGGTDEPAGTAGCGDLTATVFNGIGTGGTIAEGPFNVTQDGPGTGFWGATLGPLANGTYTLEVTQCSGPPETATETFSIELPPSIGVPTQGQTFTLDQNVAADFACNGSASCVADVYYDGSNTPDYTIHSGDAIPTGAQGPYELIVSGTDNVGNTIHSQPVWYHVDPANYDSFTASLSPLAFYQLDEGRGATTMTDSSGHGYSGTYQNNVRMQRPSALDCENLVTFTNFCATAGDWYAGSTEGTSAFFNGRSNSGAHGYANNIPLPYGAYTLEAWVNPADAGDMGILQHGSGGALYIQNGRFVFNPSSNNTSPVVTSPQPAGSYPGNPHNPGWHLVAGTWDGSTARLYVDGREAGSATGVTGLSTSTSTLFVGLTNLYGLPTFHGLIDNVAYFDSALDPDSISDQWEIGTFNSYDYVPNWPVGSDEMTPPLIYNFEPYDGAALSTDSNKKPFRFTFSTNDEADTTETCSLTDNGNPIGLTSSRGPGTTMNWSGPIPDTAGTYTVIVTCNSANGNAPSTTHTYHYSYGHFAGVMANDHPIAYYRLDELGAATTMIDSSGHGHDGEFKNDHSPFSAGVSGDSGTSRQFLGLGGYAYANGIAAPPEGYTLEGWVALADAGNQSVIEHGGAGSLFVRGGRFVFRPNVNVAVEVVGPAAGPCAPVANGSPLPASPTFQHFDAIWDGVYASLYINGHLCSTIEASVPPFASGASTLYLGFGSQEPWLRGALDEVSYYSFAFNADQVTYHQLADPPHFPRGSKVHRPIKHKPKPKPKPKRHRRGKRV